MKSVKLKVDAFCSSGRTTFCFTIWVKRMRFLLRLTHAVIHSPLVSDVRKDAHHGILYSICVSKDEYTLTHGLFLLQCILIGTDFNCQDFLLIRNKRRVDRHFGLRLFSLCLRSSVSSSTASHVVARISHHSHPSERWNYRILLRNLLSKDRVSGRVRRHDWD